MLVFILVFLLLVIGVSGLSVFFMQNTQLVTLSYFIGESSFSLWSLLLCSFAVGLVLGVVLIGSANLVLRQKNRMLRKRLNNQTQEIENLRTLPIKDAY
nr:LapA family protein [Pleionea sp. CnH1-48]